MFTQSDFIAKLNEEFSDTEKFTREDVYDQFQIYVKNKTRLKKVINLGLLHFDYAKYKALMEDTLFEDGIGYIVGLCNDAYQKNSNKFKEILVKNYSPIAKGFANVFQMCWLEDSQKEILRNDLMVKKIFQNLGDMIENSFKPFVFFLNDLRCMLQDKDPAQRKLGTAVNAMMDYNELLQALFSGLLFDISISQWRNIADHGTYEWLNDCVVVTYGSHNEYTKTLMMQELKTLFFTVDTLLYMNKTAHTLICLDYADWFKDEHIYSKDKEEIWQDNLLTQTAETSYVYGLELRVFDRAEEGWHIEVVYSLPLDKKEIVDYLSAVATFLNSEFNVLFYRNEKVEYEAIYKERKLFIYKFVV